MKRRYVSDLQKSMFLKAFLTAAFSEFSQIIALTIDSVIICTFMGEKEIGAVGLACPFLYLIGIPAACLGCGLQIVCTREMGRGRIGQVNRIFSETVLFTLLGSALMTAAVFPLIPHLAFLFGARDSAAHLHGLTTAYLSGLAFEILPFILASVLGPVVILDNGSRTAVFASIAAGVSNILLDFTAIRCGWGVFGIGLASSVSAAVSLAVLTTHLTRKQSVLRFTPVRLVRTDLSEIIRSGQPDAVQAVGGMIRSLALNALMVYLGGGIAVSVLSIHSTLLDFVEIVPVGIAGAVSILAGIAYGEKNSEELEGAGILAHRYICFSGLSALIFFLVLSYPIAQVFLPPESGGFALLRFAVCCIAVSAGFSALIYSRISYLQAIEEIDTARHMEVGSSLILLLAFSALLSVLFGAYGVFAAFPAAKGTSLLVSYALNARKAKRFDPSVSDYLELDGSFYLEPQDIIAYPITTLRESALASEQVMLFCRGHHLDRRTAFWAGLCLEEIADNVIRHGGDRAHPSPISDIRVTIADGAVILRIRDNGKAFNMSELAKILARSDSPFDNPGIKLICAEARDIGYFRIFGMNTTIIRIKAGSGASDQPQPAPEKEERK